MTARRTALTIVAAFVVSQVLAVTVHGFLLAGDYGPYYGRLLRDQPGWPMLLLPVAHLSFICGLVWVYTRAGFGGSRLARGMKLGALGFFMGHVPLWLLWFAEQPWPGELVAKQLALELASSLVIGVAIAGVAPAAEAARSLPSAPARASV
jgi:hypothetical protein